MNTKMTTNSQLSTTESKNQKQTTTTATESHRYGVHLEGYQLGGGKGEWGKRYRD